jgi:hypothetical protein
LAISVIDHRIRVFSGLPYFTDLEFLMPLHNSFYYEKKMYWHLATRQHLVLKEGIVGLGVVFVVRRVEVKPCVVSDLFPNRPT